ncbi:MAG: TlpA disulfide reductase family protein [Gammaproteobacteria bacterium]|nr:TlpA disulfide reductase family protein [Gammaproteobacteria bacterium]
MTGISRRGRGKVEPASQGGLAIGRWRTLTVLTVVLAGLSALLATQKRQLRAEAEALRETVRRQVDFPHTGMVVPAFDGVTLEGDEVRIGVAAPGTRQILFMLDTRCGNCLVTLPAWNRMAEAVAHDDASVEVYGLSLDPAPETRAYVEEHGLGFSVVLFDDERYRELYRVRGIPITLVVNEIGAVEYVRLGSIFGEWADPVVDSVVTAAVAGR